MAFGNHKGVKIDAQVAKEDLFAADFGSIVAEVPADKVAELTIAGVVVGEVEDDAVLSYGDVKVTMEEALTAWKGTLEKVFKTVSGAEKKRRTGTGEHRSTVRKQMAARSTRTAAIMQEAFMYANIKWQNLAYLFRYSQVQTANTTAQRHLNVQVQKWMSKVFKT